MTTWRGLLVLLLVAGCVTAKPSVATEPSVAPERTATAGPQDAAGAQVKSALERLPRCAPGAEAGALSLQPAACTKKFCHAACCNQCTWSATFDGMSGARPADKARVQAALGISESALDCEIAAWSQALAGQSVALEPAPCQVR